MEAELRALRDELSNRSSLASNQSQSSQATTITVTKDKENELSENEIIDKKPTNNGNGNGNGNGNSNGNSEHDDCLSIKKVIVANDLKSESGTTNSVEEKFTDSQEEPSNT